VRSCCIRAGQWTLSPNCVKAGFSEVVRTATTTPELLPERGCAICVIFFLCVLGGPKKGGAQLKRLSEALNNPKVALVVGVVAVVVNGLLYFGYYLPRMTPLIEQIQSINKALPEAISKALPEAPSGSPPESPTPPQRQTQPPPQQTSSTASPTPPPQQTPPPAQQQYL
jgi:hypothetical protein